MKSIKLAFLWNFQPLLYFLMFQGCTITLNSRYLHCYLTRLTMKCNRHNTEWYMLLSMWQTDMFKPKLMIFIHKYKFWLIFASFHEYNIRWGIRHLERPMSYLILSHRKYTIHQSVWPYDISLCVSINLKDQCHKRNCCIRNRPDKILYCLTMFPYVLFEIVTFSWIFDEECLILKNWSHIQVSRIWNTPNMKFYCLTTSP